jgi:fructan beta-fructosidase
MTSRFGQFAIRTPSTYPLPRNGEEGDKARPFLPSPPLRGRGGEGARCGALLFALLFGSLPLGAADRADILIADFEGKDYGDWKTTGTAFGDGPARGTLLNQMPVSGFLGKGLVNSFNGGDDSTGTLTSPEFKVERRFLNFLIGGGKYPGETCINLLIDGNVVRTATGPNDRPGGAEELDWHAWDVKDLAGKKAIIEIVDKRKGGWGHINVDHIVQSDSAKKPKGWVSRLLPIDERFLHFPVKNGSLQRRVRVLEGDRVVREFDIELAESKPDFLAFIDVSAFKGKELRVEAMLPGDSKALEGLRIGEKILGQEVLYAEKHRPQFHFTSRRGWLNDPNGLVYFNGEYHLFYQHNPYGWSWGNMHWGHTVSKDLVRWQELPIALYPKTFGDWAFSGSAVVDRGNTSGFGSDKEPALVAAFTSTGRGECIAFSTDRGRTWKEFDGNPVVKHSGRDPRLFRHETSKQWVMAVFDEFQGKHWIAFHTSPELKKWTFQSRIEGYFECPDIFELSVDGKKDATKWVLYAADGKYAIGSFDGKQFKTESGKHSLWHGNFYAAQTFSDAPDGRRIQIGWGNGIAFPGMPFNQQMTVACKLTLRTTPDGIRMFAVPVREIETLHGDNHAWSNVVVKPGQNPLEKIRGDLFDIRAELSADGAGNFGFTIRGTPVVYDVKKQTISVKGVTAPLKPLDGRIRLRMLVDRGSVELFANDGAVAISVGAIPPDNDKSLEFYSRGETKVIALEVFEMKSPWQK